MKTKYKQIYKEKRTGNYYYSITVKDGSVPKRYTKTFKTAEEANIAKEQLLSFLKTNSSEKDENKTLAYFRYHYIKYVTLTLKFTTLENTMQILGKYLKPFENMKIGEFCEEANLIRFRSFIKSSPISISHKNKIMNVIGLLLKYIFKTTNVSKDYLYRTEMFLKKFPLLTNETALKNKNNFWTKEECKQFLSVIDSENWYTFFYAFLILGNRLGEMQGYKVKDLDLANKIIRVQRQVVSKGIKDVRHAVVTTLKTPSSYRDIPLSDKLVSVFKTYLERHPNACPDDFLFFCSSIPQSRTTIRRVFDNYIKKAGVKRITIHGIRRSNITLMLSNENLSAVDINDITYRVGHSSPRMTLNVYMGMHKKESEKIKHSLDLL